MVKNTFIYIYIYIYIYNVYREEFKLILPLLKHNKSASDNIFYIYMYFYVFLNIVDHFSSWCISYSLFMLAGYPASLV